MPHNAERISSIRRRLLLLLSAPLALMLIAGVLIDYVSATTPLHAAYDQVLASSIVAVAAHVDVGADGKVKSELSDQAIAVLRADSNDKIFYLVQDPQGGFVAGDDGLPTAPPGRDNPAFRNARYGGEPIRVASYRLQQGAGEVTISVAETTNKRNEAMRAMLTYIVASDLLQLLATLLLVWLGVRLGLRPLLALRNQIAQRSAHDLAALDETDVPSEVRPLTRALNRLFATVGESANAQQRFLAAAAHQLRTPLAGLQAQLDILATDLHQQPDSVERVAKLQTGMRRLSHTAHQLLALARAEPTANPTNDFRKLDLQSLAEESVSVHFDRALMQKIDLGIEAEPAFVRGSTWLLRELLGNLIDNALTYTPENGRVTVRCGQTVMPTSMAFLEVEDDGPGIAASERERVLERFYRGASPTQDGSGLGLSIVDEITRAHGAQLDISSGAEARGTRVRVEFPSDST